MSGGHTGGQGTPDFLKASTATPGPPALESANNPATGGTQVGTAESRTWESNELEIVREGDFDSSEHRLGKCWDWIVLNRPGQVVEIENCINNTCLKLRSASKGDYWPDGSTKLEWRSIDGGEWRNFDVTPVTENTNPREVRFLVQVTIEMPPTGRRDGFGHCLQTLVHEYALHAVPFFVAIVNFQEGNAKWQDMGSEEQQHSRFRIGRSGLYKTLARSAWNTLSNDEWTEFKQRNTKDSGANLEF